MNMNTFKYSVFLFAPPFRENYNNVKVEELMKYLKYVLKLFEHETLYNICYVYVSISHTHISYAHVSYQY